MILTLTPSSGGTAPAAPSPRAHLSPGGLNRPADERAKGSGRAPLHDGRADGEALTTPPTGAARRPGRVAALFLALAGITVMQSRTAYSQCAGPITSTTAGDVITNSGCLTSAGTGGIVSSGNASSIINSGSITTSGVNSPAIDASGAATTITNTGTMTTSGSRGHGIRTTGSAMTISNFGTIATTGNNAPGFRTEGYADTMTNHGTITTRGDASHGIRGEGEFDRITNTGTIITSGPSAQGIRSSRLNATIGNTGQISVSGTESRGIWSIEANASISNSGTIWSGGPLGYGIHSQGMNSQISNSGNITANAHAIVTEGSNVQINNSGNIASASYGIYSISTNTNITNAGNITASSHAVVIEGSGAHITNSGSLIANAGSFGILVSGGGSVTMLTNAQGGTSPLTYSGALPAAYHIVVRSTASFGRLAVTNGSGSLAFGVDARSNLVPNRYTNVLTGVTAAGITNEETRSVTGGIVWMLTAGSSPSDWDLLAWRLGPDATRTGLALQANARAVGNALSQRAATINHALDHDCASFDRHGLCVAFGLRGAQFGSNQGGTSEASGLLTAAYRLTERLRLGGFMDQPLASSTRGGVAQKNISPMVGAFAIYQQNADFRGLTLRAGLSFQQGDLRITRTELMDTEPGAGRAGTRALAFGGELAYGVPVGAGWISQPYLGLRRTEGERRGYTEATSENVQYPISYGSFGQQVTSTLAGLRFRGPLTPQLGLILGAGVEYDLQSRTDRYAGSSNIPELESFSFNASQSQNRLRGVVSLGLHHAIASNQALLFDASLRQLPYGNDLAAIGMVRYAIGF